MQSLALKKFLVDREATQAQILAQVYETPGVTRKIVFCMLNTHKTSRRTANRTAQCPSVSHDRFLPFILHERIAPPHKEMQ